MSMTNDVQSFLMGGGGAPSAFTKHDGKNTRRGGRIVEPPELRQQTEYKTEKPLTWPDGNPRMQLLVTVQTDQRNPAKTDDDGQRRFFIKGDLQRAVREAVKDAGASGLEVGGSLFVTRLRQEGEYDAWVHEAEYIPAAANFVHDIPKQGNGAATQAAAAHVAAAPQAADEPPAHLTPEVKAAWANLPAETKAALKATA